MIARLFAFGLVLVIAGTIVAAVLHDSSSDPLAPADEPGIVESLSDLVD